MTPKQTLLCITKAGILREGLWGAGKHCHTTHTSFLPAVALLPYSALATLGLFFNSLFLLTVKQEYFNGHNRGTYYIKSKFPYCNPFPLFIMMTQSVANSKACFSIWRLRPLQMLSILQIIPQHLRNGVKVILWVLAFQAVSGVGSLLWHGSQGGGKHYFTWILNFILWFDVLKNSRSLQLSSDHLPLHITQSP